MIEGYSKNYQKIWIKDYLTYDRIHSWNVGGNFKRFNWFPHLWVLTKLEEAYKPLGIDRFGIHLLLRWYGLANDGTPQAQQEDFQRVHTPFWNLHSDRERMFWLFYFENEWKTLIEEQLSNETNLHYLPKPLMDEKELEEKITFYGSFEDRALQNERYYPMRWERTDGRPLTWNGVGMPKHPTGKLTTWCWRSRKEFEKRFHFVPDCLDIFNPDSDFDKLTNRKIKEKYYGRFKKGEYRYANNYERF